VPIEIFNFENKVFLCSIRFMLLDFQIVLVIILFILFNIL